jgi:4-alpha-glucanotransferase
MMNTLKARRVVGVTVPLFSLRTQGSWGIGEIGDLPLFGRFVHDAGVRLVQLLPLGELSGGETSPYSALSAFGIDPMYISYALVDELPADELQALLGDDGIRTLAWLRAQPTVAYEAVRWLKNKALDAAFQRFKADVWGSGCEREKDFRTFCKEHHAWLDDYALFRAIKEACELQAWWTWPPGVRARDAKSLAAARIELASKILRHQYAQWLAHTQWDNARKQLRAMDIEIMGDLPFMVGRDSADVWAHREEFRGDASVGVPGDQFDPEGQEWGLPPYDWRVMRSNGFAWLRARARYAGVLYDRFRVDHLVGFYRTYMRATDRLRGSDGKLLPGTFDPANESEQLTHGEAVIGAMIAGARETGATLVAEDLGVVPDFVRPSLTRMKVPGYKVLIWEQDQGVFRDPAQYPALSVACFATHDTAPVAAWWEALPTWEREAVCRLPALASRGGESLGDRFTPAVHSALLHLVLGARSDVVLLMVQDILGVKDRINVPGTVGAHNWTWCLPETLETLSANTVVKAAQTRVREAIVSSGR